MTVDIRHSLVLTQLHLHLLGEVVSFFGQQPIIIIAKIASLLPKLVHLRIFSFWDCPDSLALALVPLAILFNALLYLALIQTMGSWPSPGPGLGSWSVCHFNITVGRCKPQIIVVCSPLLDDILNLRNNLVL